MTDTLEKAVVAQFLEAAKSALSYLSEVKLQLAEAGRQSSAIDEHSLLQLYSRVRRVREYLRRWMSAYPTPNSIDLPDDDLNLLVSCFVYELNRCEKLAVAPGAREGDAANWLEQRKAIYAHWVVALATKPIDHLPTVWSRLDLTYTVRQVVAAVQEKLKPGGGGPPAGFSRYGGASPAPGAQAPAPAPAAAAAPGPSPQSPAPVQAPPPAQAAALQERASNLVDTSRIRDYRLRLTMVLDIRAYHRCVEAEDYLAIVLLGMVLEGILIDHGLARKDELALSGPPEHWSLEPILVSVLDTEYGDRERAAFTLLQKAQRLLRPASQLDEPIAVNRAMLQVAETLVRRAGSAIGVSAGGGGSIRINW